MNKGASKCSLFKVNLIRFGGAPHRIDHDTGGHGGFCGDRFCIGLAYELILLVKKRFEIMNTKEIFSVIFVLPFVKVTTAITFNIGPRLSHR